MTNIANAIFFVMNYLTFGYLDTIVEAIIGLGTLIVIIVIVILLYKRDQKKPPKH